MAASASARTTATEEAKNAAKLGLSVHQYRMLGPTVRKRRLDSLEAKSGTKSEHRIRTGAFAGLLPSQVDQMTPDQIQKRIDAAAKKPKPGETTDKKAFRAKYGVDLQPTSQHNKARDSVQNAQTAFGQVGKITARKDGSKKRVTTDEVVSVLRGQGVSNVLIRAALDIQRYGHITPGTANRLHKAGYSVGTLGFHTGAPTRHGGRSTTQRAPRQEHLP